MADPIPSTGEKRDKRGAAKRAAPGGNEPPQTPAPGLARAAAEPLSEPASAAGEAFDREAGGLGEQLLEAAESLVREQKERAAEAVHDFADALRHAADTFEREQNRVAARYVEQAADRIDGFSETMRVQSVQAMLASAEDVARRQPALFITGAVAVGFVLGRVLSRSGGSPADRARGYAMTAGESGYHPAVDAAPSDSDTSRGSY
jgi:ElaB/YqjD/DUF883 family membrane-anchored ribosome-binding protein